MRMPARRASLRARAATALLAGWLVGCVALGSELDTAAELYDDAQYEAAQRWLSELASQSGGMSRTQQARYYYLRGMTAYRLGQRQDALHYLALAMAAADTAGAALRPERRVIMERTLAEITPEDASHVARSPGRS